MVQEKEKKSLPGFAKEIGITRAELIERQRQLVQLAKETNSDLPVLITYEPSGNLFAKKDHFITPEGQELLGNQEIYKTKLRELTDLRDSWCDKAAFLSETGISEYGAMQIRAVMRNWGEDFVCKYINESGRGGKIRYNPEFVEIAKHWQASKEKGQAWEDIITKWAKDRDMEMPPHMQSVKSNPGAISR